MQLRRGRGGQPGLTYGVQVAVASGVQEVDVHSNDIDAGGPPPGAANSCQGRGISIDLMPGMAMAQKGIFRNNILRAGVCGTSRVSFLEAVAGADPRIVENNDFDPTGAPTALYLDEAVTSLAMVSAVNALADITAGMNISMDPLYVSYPMDFHLQAGSPCINAGTATGAPLVDMDGLPRDAMPDIGADEH